MESDGVPEKIIELLEEEVTALEAVNNKLKLSIGLIDTNDRNSIEHASYLIDVARRSLTEIDQNLSSNYSMLSGYMQILDAEESQQIEDPIQPPVDPYGSPATTESIESNDSDDFPRYPIKEKQYRSE